ncbi:MAG: T9SS type A sorting domain-containing protein [Cytophagales bacterium]|nr:T9SS type A sorting domain-containing protein [Cytophagales bacterium]
MRKTIGWIGLVVLLSHSTREWEEFTFDLNEPESSIGTQDNPHARADFEFLKIRNPKTGKIPENIRQKEIEFSKKHLGRSEWLSARNDAMQSEEWTLAGPFNVGGRTRALALDVQNENTIISGGVSGGIWKSSDSGASWIRTSDPENRNGITTLAQDIRSGKQNIWYYGTGELKGNSARAGGAPYRGDGLFKSTDSGESWTQLVSTADSEPTVFGSQFQYIWRIVTNENRADADELLVAAYGGILRSEDGGNSWIVELGEDLNNLPPDTDLNESIAPFYTEVAKNGAGHFYASMSQATSSSSIQYTNAGFYWSEDGDNWFDISPPELGNLNLARTVISVVGNMAYFFSNKVKNDPKEEDVSYLFQYELGEILPDGTPTGQWTNLTENLPDFDGIGNLDTQSGFNMTIRIDPGNSNVVFLGGTNLYRSTDGFETANNTDWIGGYKDEENVEIYDNHHPDQHDVIFYSSDTKKMLSANDGGIHITQNSHANTVSWSSLNNGYVTSQFYTVNIPKSESNDIITGGLQDNGSQMNVSNISNSSWTKTLGGDGAYSATVTEGIYWYFSFQNSQIYRLSLNESLKITNFARVDPTDGASQSGAEYLFINPYVLDPNNPNIMYLAGGNAIWRNNNLAQIPGGSQETTELNWDLLETTILSDEIISTLEVTTNSQYLYYGTTSGGVYRLENPSINGSEVLNSIQQSNLPSDAYVSCIAANPEDETEILTVFSNYTIPSIFQSSDAGETFVDVSGNLEEFSDGTGNGPSVRWAEVVPLENGTRYFVGTSTGLYSTDALNGSSTIWLKEDAENIGKAVVVMMDYRPLDGRFVVATHGNGVFKTTIDGFKQITPSSQGEKFALAHSFPNPFSDNTTIEFEIPETDYLRVDIFDMYGNHVRNLFSGYQYAGKSEVTWDGRNQFGSPLKDGMYIYRLYYDGKIVGGRMVYNR